MASADMAVPSLSSSKLTQTNLVSDQAGVGAHTDANLVNAWGLAFNPAGPAWVAANGTGKAAVYDANGMQVLLVTIPAPTGGATSAPTGQVFNGSTNFMGDKFILATEDGTIAGWQSGTVASIRVDNSASGAVYKGVAIMTSGGVSRLYATNFHSGKVDVYDGNYTKVTQLNNPFEDSVPQGFAPFNIVAIDSLLYVTYAKQDAMAHDDVKGPGNGFVNTFNFDGVKQSRFASQGVLNSPWAVVKTPADFGGLSNMILIGNFGDGTINAFDSAGAAGPAVMTATATPLVIDGLWSLIFGNDTAGQAHNQLFFTAGPGGEMHGLYGRLDIAP
jgi:uncharacterized protein (TIGR03118 family)